MVRRRKNRRGPAPGEIADLFLKESVALPWVPRKRGEGETNNPWSALLNGPMLTQRMTCGNDAGALGALVLGRRIKIGIDG